MNVVRFRSAAQGNASRFKFARVLKHFRRSSFRILDAKIIRKNVLEEIEQNVNEGVTLALGRDSISSIGGSFLYFYARTRF